MKDIEDILIEMKRNNGLPILPELKKNPEWLYSYPEFKDKMEEIWDDDKLFASTLMYFINGKFDTKSSFSDYTMAIRELYHK